MKMKTIKNIEAFFLIKNNLKINNLMTWTCHVNTLQSYFYFFGENTLTSPEFHVYVTNLPSIFSLDKDLPCR